MQWTIKSAKDYSGGLSIPSKMPGFAYSLPSDNCITGMKLAEHAGTTCAKCYTFKGNYRWPNVIAALKKRLRAIKKKKWVDAMAFQINFYAAKGDLYFRWHDSGDLQSIEHLQRIIEVCKQTPMVTHWLPTREYSMIKEYLATGNKLPDNLTVRVSSPLINVYQIGFVKMGLPVSGVHSDESKAKGHCCPAIKQGGVCGDCRACWDKDVSIVSYHVH